LTSAVSTIVQSEIPSSRLTLGTVVRIWHHPRGHDYVVAAKDNVKHGIYLLRLNCVNNDLSINKNSYKFHGFIPYSEVGRLKVISRVTRVIGHKALNTAVIQDFINDHNANCPEDRATLMSQNDSYICSPVSDARNQLIL
jgi:hypothetical protein